MASIPRLRGFDSSFALLADPYRFIGKHCRALRSDVFETRLLLQRTICLQGAQAAQLFYDPERFQRQGAAPEPLRATLFGKGTVQSLDGERHRVRKALFMASTGGDEVAALVAQAEQAWRERVRDGEGVGPVSLYDLAREVLTRAVCTWAGVPVSERELPLRTRQLSLLFDAAAGGPLQHLRSRRARARAESWLAGVIHDLRGAALADGAAPSAALRAARHTDADGRLLAPRLAAAELLNLLRPTVAVAVFIVFAAHALHEHPGWRSRLRVDGNAGEVEAFVQEVRRYYPFFPAVIARVRRDFEWNGFDFPRGRRVMLDLYGTNHDARRWQAPAKFRPERFFNRRAGLFDFIPQGGGVAQTQHRCPGEGVTTALMAQAVDLLVHRLDIELPPQDFTIDYGRLPALPRDRCMLRRLRWIG